jgi:UDP-GlcNAc3NAcA epimerase
MTLKIVTVVGARPQFIKAAVVSRALAAEAGVVESIVHTGQHYDDNMSQVFFDDLRIPPPTHNLGIGGGSHGHNTGQMLGALEDVFSQEQPDWVLVYGDTDTTLAGMLAASKLGIRVAHVEAGLRSFNRFQPEEINRILADHGADALFAPTEAAMSRLRIEGLADKSVLTGDVMYDAALFYAELATPPDALLQRLSLRGEEFVLATIHRAENTDRPDRLTSIIHGLARSGRPVVLPLHPRTRQRLTKHGLYLADNVRAIAPVSYLEMIGLEQACQLIATDSGGVQKEAFFYQRPCVTLRNETEWVELVELGANRLVGSDADAIAEALNGSFHVDWSARPYGDGNASRRVATHLLSWPQH